MSGVYTMAVLATLGGGPGFDGGYCADCNSGAAQVAYDGGYADVGGVGYAGGIGDELFPYDSPYPWMHGYFQKMPTHAGYGAFKPYNYKHVLSQSRAAAGWGLNPQMPYSQHFWARYHHRASMTVPASATPTIPPRCGTNGQNGQYCPPGQ